MSISLSEWLTTNSFEGFRRLEDSFDTLEELADVKAKAIRSMGGTDEDHARLVASVRRHLQSTSAAQVSSQAQAQSALLSRLPIFVADLHQQLLEETHPRVRLSRLFDVAEMLTRWVAAVLVSALREPESGCLPADLARVLRTEIERPSFGKWLGIVRHASGTLRVQTATGAIGVGLLSRWNQPVAGTKQTWPEALTKRLSPVVQDRNHFIHGGGGTLGECRTALNTHLPLLEALLAELAEAMDGVDIVAVKGGTHFTLKGVSAVAVPVRAGTPSDNGIWLHDAEQVLLLWPLMHHGGSPSDMGETLSPGVYLSVGKKGNQLKLQPPASAEMGLFVIQDADFRHFFQLDEAKATESPAQRTLDAARREAEQLVGRGAELQQIMTWLNQQVAPDDARVGLLYGGPGLGKSTLIAGVVTAVADARPADSPDRLHVHRFRRGDSDNSPDAFWQGLLELLQVWGLKGNDEKAPGESASRRQQISYWLSLLPTQTPASRLVCLIDGLDEVAAAHPTFAAELVGLALPGTTWLISSREEPAIVQAFTMGESARGERVLSQGLQPMGAAGIREMLLAALPAAVRCRLLGLDKDDASGIQAPDNDFVRAVVHRAGGNPLYVRFLLDDLELGLSLDKGRLPQGLEGYYRDLLNRLGASDVARTLPPVVALLACAEEPLPPKSLLALIPHAPSARVLDEALLLGGAMFRYAPTPDGQEGLTLYHTNFREYILREDSPLSETVTEARRLLWERAEAWAEEEDGGLQGHLFRKGNGYALAWGGDKGRAQVLERLADFTYLMARLARPETSDLNGLLEEYRQLRSNALASLAVWEEFFRTHIHVLRRGDLGGVADRLLFTQALNSAGAGTVQSAAEDYLAYGQVTWHYLRVSSVAPPQARPTLTFDRNSIVTGVINLSGDYLLAYYADGNVTRWNVRTGAAVWSMHVHEGPVLGVIVLDDMRCLSWAMQDRHLKIWSLEDGQPIVQSKPAHSSYLGVQGVVAIAPDRVLSWSADGILSQWSALSLERLAQIQTTLIVRSCHSLSDASVLLLCDDGVYRWDFVNGSTPNEILSCSQSAILSDGRILTANAQTLTLWNAGLTDVIAELPGKLREAKTAAAGGNGSVLLEVDSNCLCLWHPESGATATMAEHDSPIDGFELLPDGRILTWSRNQAVCVWDPSLGQVTTRVAHHDWIRGALLLDRASLLTWADDRKMCLWHLSQQQPSTEATLPARLPVKGVVELDATRLILWDDSETLRLWNAEIETCAPLDGLHEFSVNGVIANSSRHLLSWDDKTVHVRDYRTLELIAVLRNKKGRLADVMPLDGDRLLTWAEGDNVLRLWRIDTQVEIASFAAPAPVCGARRMTRERILVWLSDRTLHLISARDLSALSVLPSKGSISASFGHAKSVTLAGELDTGEVFSWSRGEEILRFWDFDNDRMLRPLCGVTSMDELPHGWFHLEFRDGHPGLWKPGRDLDVDARLIRLGRGPVRGSLMTDGADLVVGECGAWVIDGLREPKEAPSVRRELAVMQGEVMQVGVGPWRRPTQEPTASCRTADWYNPSIRRLLHAWPDGRFLVDADGPVCLHLHMGMERLPWA